MCEFKQKLVGRYAKITGFFLIEIIFMFFWSQYYAGSMDHRFLEQSYIVVMFCSCILYLLFLHLYDAMNLSAYRWNEIVLGQVLSQILTNVIMYCVSCFLTLKILNILPVIVASTVQLAVSAAWICIFQKLYIRSSILERMIIIYGEKADVGALIKEHGLDKKYNIGLRISETDVLNNLTILDEAETVLMVGMGTEDRNEILKYCWMRQIHILVMPCLGDIIMQASYPVRTFRQPVFRVDQSFQRPEYTVLKRLFDIVSAAVALVILSPLMLVVSIVIKAADGGPAFYKQDRLTRDGKVFKIIKFRSMRMDAEKDGVARLSTGTSDERVTSIGRFIRKVRIDELPQLLNVLRGEMSICGPRPERPEIAEEYEKEMPEFRMRLQVKAGLTGYAQVYGKYNSTPYDKLQMDLMYITHANIWTDIHIMLATIKVIFLAESTEGVAEGSRTAMRKGSQTEKIRYITDMVGKDNEI